MNCKDGWRYSKKARWQEALGLGCSSKGVAGKEYVTHRLSSSHLRQAVHVLRSWRAVSGGMELVDVVRDCVHDTADVVSTARPPRVIMGRDGLEGVCVHQVFSVQIGRSRRRRSTRRNGMKVRAWVMRALRRPATNAGWPGDVRKTHTHGSPCWWIVIIITITPYNLVL